jgi:gluconolactonase
LSLENTMSTVHILAEGLAFPEGPAFAPDGSLWFVELEGAALTRWERGRLERTAVGGEPNGLAFDTRGRAWLCDARQNALRRWHTSDTAPVTVVDHMHGEPLNSPNDLAFDARGNLVFTCPGNAINVPTGYVCCLQPDGTLRKIAEDLYFPNGLAFSEDGQRLVVAETYRQRLLIGDWDDEECSWKEVQPWAEVGGSDGPDGMAFGTDGLLYVAVYSLGCVKAIAPDGSIAAIYDLPGRNPTNCAFDPSGRLGLIVTEAEQGRLLSLPHLGPGIALFDGGNTWTGV